jgi:hypothetical protein
MNARQVNQISQRRRNRPSQQIVAVNGKADQRDRISERRGDAAGKITSPQPQKLQLREMAEPRR